MPHVVLNPLDCRGWTQDQYTDINRIIVQVLSTGQFSTPYKCIAPSRDA